MADLRRSVAFYERVIGFSRLDLPATGDGRSARLGVRGDSRTWLELHEREGARPVPPRGHLGLYHFAVLLPGRPDLGAFLGHVIAGAIRFGAADHLVSEALYLVDPDGITIEVYCDRPRAEWVYRDGQLVATVDPLDTAGVLNAAGAGIWDALPPGTVMGHVHFYVGDLAAAHEFYVGGLGFETMITSLPGALFVAAGGYHHHVGLNTWAAGSPMAAADDARLLSWDLVVPDPADLARASDRLRTLGIPVETDRDAPTATDPWNIRVRLVTA